MSKQEQPQTDEAKPCPFCGDEPEVTKHFREDMYRLIHRCWIGCLEVGWRDDPGAVVAKWNQRAPQ